MSNREVLEGLMNSSVYKSSLSLRKMIVLSILAGIFIAVAGVGANSTAFIFMADPKYAAIGRAISGIVFPAGLMMVALTGAELFTGNNLMVTGLLDSRIHIVPMLKNWIVVYIGNLIGSVFIAYLIYQSGLLTAGDGLFEKVSVNIAVSKVSLSFSQAFIRGILCNLLVCTAVWIAAGAKSTNGKILGIFFPIWLFVASGFEHSVANMYFIPLGIFANGVGHDALTWTGFFVDNLLPVTLGNMIGGCILAGATYYFAYRKA